MAMDETSCRGRTKHRTSEERTPVGTQSAEGYCRKCDQRDPGRRRDELPEAPQSFLAHFSVLPDERMERDAHPARPASPQYSIPMCLRITFSGSTNSESPGSWEGSLDGSGANGHDPSVTVVLRSEERRLGQEWRC